MAVQNPRARYEPKPVAAIEPKLLLVDDDPHMLSVLSRTLKSLGYGQTTSVASAKAALTHLQSAPLAADVIICDLNMPGMDGIDLLQRLNADERQRSVILLSGEGNRVMHSVQKLLIGGQLQVLGAITKPAGRIALQELLGTWSSPGSAAVRPQPPVAAVTAAELYAASAEGQWVLHYQPQVDLRTGKAGAVEALVRWNHPEHGLIHPDHFINAAEACGAIDAMTDWVLQDALRQCAAWRTQGLAIQIGINISRVSLLTPDFARRFNSRVRDAGASPHDVTLEITESQLTSSSSTPLENLVRLRLYGFCLSIDDFGTGQSSLLQLRDVPFTELKVDRGFVHGARHNQIIRPILESSLGVSKRMGLRSVAEGVETQSDWELLRELGCESAQGYFIGRPMPAERIWEWLNVWQARTQELIDS
jgi:EAL domain-containing protein (putative c-di-GMP-specific phosphodiesterase class I)